jgi:rubrerythrin
MENADLKNLFDTLADKELHHKEVFEKLKEQVSEQVVEAECWEEVTLYMRAIVESEFFLGKYKALPSMEKVKSIADAVKFAIGFEKETLLYFLGVRDVVEHKSLIDEIIDEERSHIRWLSAFKTSLQI